MIDDKAIILAHGFKAFWSNIFVNYSRYQLDFSWPSVGIVDLILSPLHNKKEYSQQELSVITEAAAYLAGIIHDVWVSFPRAPNVALSVSGANQEIILKLHGVKGTTRQKPYIINVSKELINILQNPKNPFPFFADYERFLSADTNVISLFVLGIISTCSPYGEGPLKEIDPQSVIGHLIVTQGKLSELSASYYQKAYPGEEIGANFELYSNGLILPPSGYKERFPLEYALSGFLRFYSEQKIDTDKLYILLHNLACFPDERISDSGLALILALSSLDPKKNVSLLVDSKITRWTFLRRAVLQVGGLTGRNINWVNLIKYEDFKEAKIYFQLERDAGLLPILRLPFELCIRKELYPLICGLSWGQTKECGQFLDIMLTDRSVDPDLVVQSIYLDIISGEFINAENKLKAFRKLLPEENRYWGFYYELEGLMLFTRNDFQNSENSLKKALNYNVFDAASQRTIFETLVRTLIQQQKKEEALTICRDAIKISNPTLTLLVDYCYLLKDLGDEDEFAKQVDALIRRAPMDRRVFSLFLCKKHESLSS